MTPAFAHNAANSRAPRQPDRNRLIVALKTAHPRMSFSAIGERVGCSRGVVAGVLDRAGLVGVAPESLRSRARARCGGSAPSVGSAATSPAALGRN